MLIGHGWRQVEVRRIRAGDVRDVQDGMIWVRGKERDEWAPVLPVSLERLQELGQGLTPNDCIFQGQRGPLGEDGMSQLVDRLYARAGIKGFTGHDLRRTFATQVRLASGDEFLAMRLLRDKIPGVNDRYLVFPHAELMAALSQYSPLHRITMVETGEGRTPRPEDSLSQDMLQA
jgi:integrase